MFINCVGMLLICDTNQSRAKLRAITLKSSYVLPLLSDPQFSFFFSLFPVDSSESVKQRNDVFYLQPERSCVPNSPMWYSTFPIDPGTLDTMLTRILMVREVHEELAKAKSEDSDVELSD